MRPIWSGAISFGLIYIPVKLYSATKSQELDFNLLRKDDLCRIQYVRVCRDTGEEVPYSDIVKGYEYRDGDYVVLDEQDFKRANVKKTQTIEIESFVEETEIDSKYMEKPYYLEPTKPARKAYALLREALRRSKKVAVARFVLRSREHIATLKADGDTLVLNQMRFESEIVSSKALDVPDKSSLAKDELNMALKLVDALTEKWQPKQYKDEYTADLKMIIQEKIEGKAPEEVEVDEAPIEVTDLFAKLNESLKAVKAGR